MKTELSKPCFMNGEMIQSPHSFSILSLAIPEKTGICPYKLEERSKVEI